MKRIWSFLLAAMLLLGLTACGSRAEAEQDPLAVTGQWLMESAPEPTLGHEGGEWLILGLARSELEVPATYYETYLKNLTRQVEECGGQLSDRKYTEFSRVILALTALGEDPATATGYDLVAPLADYEKTVYQGINGPIFALIALDSGNYQLPQTQTAENQGSRERYLQMILDRESEGGGWALVGGPAEPDMTAMALQALAPYRDRADVAEAVERGLEALSRMQNEQGGFALYGEETSEAAAQTVVALTALGISLEEPRFVKNGTTVLERLMDFRQKDGSFSHLVDGEADQMATEQAFYAMVAAWRAEQGMSSLYQMKADNANQ